MLIFRQNFGKYNTLPLMRVKELGQMRTLNIRKITKLLPLNCLAFQLSFPSGFPNLASDVYLRRLPYSTL